MLLLPLHTAALPLMLPGVAGGLLTATDSDCAAELPHPLFAVTDIVPPVDAAVTVIVSELEVPFQPFGIDQV